jgi:regulation of enolase protein 1 (concanavalin A-like superfamily)
MHRIKLLLVGLGLLSAGLNAQLITYTWPSGEGEAWISEYYKVYVTHGSGEEEEVQVLKSNAIYSGDYREDYLKGRTFSFAQVSYDESEGKGLRFRVEKVYGTPATKASLSPKSYGLEHKLSEDGRELTFGVDTSNRYISVHYITPDNQVYVDPNQTWIKHMLCIFINPPESGAPRITDPGVVVYSPDKPQTELEAASVVYFPAGYHNLEEYQHPGDYISARGKLTLKNGQDLYMEGGAFLEGNIYAGGDNSRISGRGILSMRQYQWKNSDDYDGYDAGYIIHLGKNCIVEGIMCMEPPWHGIVGGSGNLIENIKFLGWHSNNDGVRVGSGSEIRNSFIRAVDDDFYNFNIYVHDMVLWKGHNGSIMTYGWGGNNTYNSGASLMENVDVIHPEWTGLGNNNGLIMSQTAYDYKPYDYGTGSTLTTFRNIRIEGKIPGLINVKTRQGGDPIPNVELDKVGYLGDLRLENITVNKQFDRGLIAGKSDVASNGNADYFVQNVTLEEVRIGGVCVTDENKNLFFQIDEATTRDLFFRGCNETGISIAFVRPLDGDQIVVGDSLEVIADISTDTGSLSGATLFLNEKPVSEKTGPPFIWRGESQLVDMQIGDYTLKVVASNTSGDSWEESIQITVTPLPNMENLSILVKSDSSLLLEWEDPIETEQGIIIERALAGSDSFVRLDTLAANNTMYLDTGLEDFTLYAYRIRTLYESGASQASKRVLGRPLIRAHAPLPDAWKNAVYGDTLVAMSSTATFSNDTFTIDAGDGDFWTEQDRGHFMYQTLSGDCEIVAQVSGFTHAQSYSMAGVMIRDTLSAGSPFATMFLISSPGAIVRFRQETKGPVNQEINNTGELAPYWVRLRRTGDTFTGSVSPDGTSWKIVRSGSIPMSPEVRVGLAATTHTTDTVGNYAFTKLSLGIPANEYTIRASASTGGRISPPGSHLVLEGATLSFSFEADEGYELAEVLVDDLSEGMLESYTFSDIASDHSIRANFQRTVSVSAEQAGQSLKIYPNPASDRVHLDFSGTPEGDGAFCLLDVTGAVLCSGKLTRGSGQVDISALEPGIYLFQVKLDEQTIIRKLLIE